ncbi:MAG TPA: hypothetical protein EYG03_30815 [Planctomycetes bacterium]|nr:hypothetical protein [Fuerstiella sp.]HIK96356.1 hypothetical protein [Planctomycetota bacterium]
MSEDKPNKNDGDAVAGETSAEQILPGSLSAPTLVGENALLLSPIPGLILSGLVACLVWGALEVLPPVFQIQEHLRDLEGNLTTAQSKEIADASVAASNKNAAFSLALLASTMGLFLTIAEVKIRRQGLRAIWAAPLAVLIAGVFAVGGGILGGMLTASPALPEDPLTRTIIVQGTMFGLVGLGVGAGVGLAVTLPMFGPRLLSTCIAGGTLGGLLAGLIFPFAASVFLPNARTEVLMPDPGVSRLLWLALASCAIVLPLTGMGKGEKTGT